MISAVTPPLSASAHTIGTMPPQVLLRVAQAIAAADRKARPDADVQLVWKVLSEAECDWYLDLARIAVEAYVEAVASP